jgi:DNA-binding NtrC family response regulator
LAEYPWPGNVRELENLVERELIRHKRGRISFGTLEPKKLSPTASTANRKFNNLPTTNLEEMTRNHITMVLQMTDGKVHGPNGAAELLGMKSSTLRARMDKLGIPYGRKK